jgi:cellulose biosynthesis protein BcsQ
VATNLAVLRSVKSKDVLLIDADDQETATDFTILRNEQLPNGAGYTSIKLSGSAVRTEVLQLSDKFKDIIIDTGGRDTTSQRAALSVADVLLIPFVPRSFDVWTLEKVSAESEIWITGEGFTFSDDSGVKQAQEYNEQMENALKRDVHITRFQTAEPCHPEWAKMLKKLCENYPNNFHLYIKQSHKIDFIF